jgi:hypothetical protein
VIGVDHTFVGRTRKRVEKVGVVLNTTPSDAKSGGSGSI